MTGAPKNPEFAAVVRASFARQSLMTTLGARLVAVEPGAVAIEAPTGSGVLQQQGFAHGGFVFSLGDSAAGYSALSLLPTGAEVLTVEMKVNFLAPAAGVEVIARGRVIRPGYRISTVASDVFVRDSGGRETHIAALQGTMITVGGT